MKTLEELQKTIDDVEAIYSIIRGSHDVAYAAVVKAYDDYNDRRNELEKAKDNEDNKRL